MTIFFQLHIYFSIFFPSLRILFIIHFPYFAGNKSKRYKSKTVPLTMTILRLILKEKILLLCCISIIIITIFRSIIWHQFEQYNAKQLFAIVSQSRNQLKKSKLYMQFNQNICILKIKMIYKTILIQPSHTEQNIISIWVLLFPAIVLSKRAYAFKKIGCL